MHKNHTGTCLKCRFSDSVPVNSDLADLETYECILASMPDDSDTGDLWPALQEALP